MNDYYAKLFASLDVAEMIKRNDEYFLIQQAVICGAVVKENLYYIIEESKKRKDSNMFSYLIERFLNERNNSSFSTYNSIINEKEYFTYFGLLCEMLDVEKMISRGDEIFLIKYAMISGAKRTESLDKIFDATMTRKDFIDVLKLIEYFYGELDYKEATNSAYKAIKNNYLDYAKFLIEHGADSNGLLKIILDSKRDINCSH